MARCDAQVPKVHVTQSKSSPNRARDTRVPRHGLQTRYTPEPSSRCTAPMREPIKSKGLETMAIIRSFRPGGQSVRLHRSEVDCYFQTVTASNGSAYLHLTTFGSDDREIPGKSSQSFQLSVEAARELLVIIVSTFGAALVSTRATGGTDALGEPPDARGST